LARFAYEQRAYTTANRKTAQIQFFRCRRICAFLPTKCRQTILNKDNGFTHSDKPNPKTAQMRRQHQGGVTCDGKNSEQKN
jgi:hypothetical protein